MSNQLGEDISAEPMDATPTIFGVNLGSASVQNALNVTEVGELYSVSMGILATTEGTCTANLEIQTDGQATQLINLFTGGTRNAGLQAFVTYVGATGALNILMTFKARYSQSLRVGVNVAVAGSSTLYVGVTRGRRY